MNNPSIWQQVSATAKETTEIAHFKILSPAFLSMEPTNDPPARTYKKELERVLRLEKDYCKQQQIHMTEILRGNPPEFDHLDRHHWGFQDFTCNLDITSETTRLFDQICSWLGDSRRNPVETLRFFTSHWWNATGRQEVVFRPFYDGMDEEEDETQDVNYDNPNTLKTADQPGFGWNQLGQNLWEIEQLLKEQNDIYFGLEFDLYDFPDDDNVTSDTFKDHARKVRKAGDIPRQTHEWANLHADPTGAANITSDAFLRGIHLPAKLDLPQLALEILTLPEAGIEQALIRISTARIIVTGIEHALPLLATNLAEPPDDTFEQLLFIHWNTFGRQKYLSHATRFKGIDGINLGDAIDGTP